ncbi:MAG: TonB-dependent receptor [bacterium]|nr:TonB-dependent receptor [bacterium]
MFLKCKRFASLYLVLISVLPLFAQSNGVLHGYVRDRQTQEAIPGASILLVNTKLGIQSDLNGKYRIENVPLGTYSIRFSAMGYREAIRSDITISPGRTSYLTIDLEPQSHEASEMVVLADPFEQAPEISTSTLRLQQEEIRRAPGAREDLSRAIQIMPGVQMTSDDRNDLVVRGGSPTEVLFRIDGIEFPNPNHFGTQGATGGPIGMVNNDFVQEVNFLSGGFPARFGDKTSAVIDVTYREGAPKFTGSGYIGFAGAGVTLEGPLAKKRGTYLTSYRKSYLDLISGLMNYGALPKYQDFQLKTTQSVSERDRLTLLAIAGENNIHFDPDLEDSENPATEDLHWKSVSGVVGVNYTRMFPKLGFTRVIVSHDRARYITTIDTLESFETKAYNRAFYNFSTEWQTDFRNEWNFRLNKNTEVNTGVQWKQVGFDYTVYWWEPITTIQNGTPVNNPVYQSAFVAENSYKAAGYLSITRSFGPFWILNTGVRYDYFDFSEASNWSPRFGATYRIDAERKLTFSYGLFAQTPPLMILAGNLSNQHLKNMLAEHAVIGYEHILNNDTRLTFEMYDKRYRQVPVTSERYRWGSLQNAGAEYGGVGTFDAVSNDGTGRSYGVEMMFQKKLKDGLYGIASASWSRTSYTPADGVGRWGQFDSPVVANIVGGWKPNNRVEFSFKWTYASGAPYTPLMESISEQLNYQVYDTLHVYSERRTPYHRLDLRYDYRFFFTNWNLVTWFSIENIYNRQNFYNTYWNRKTKEQITRYQSGFFPIGGFTFEW